ncbi:MAG: ABC transporter permease [Acidobacteria bacterium]|jgi:putative ABC transport system permease protein|nr:ABC transporter permease [Acidobacteriota bacterium]
MKIGETIRVAFGSLRSNKLRSSLTILGIVIGIFSIISISTVLSMMQNSIEEGLSELGKYTFQIQKLPRIQMGRLSDKIWNRKNINIEEYYRFRDLLTEAKYVGAEQWHFGCRVKSQWDSTNPNVSAVGVTPEAILTNQWTVESGRSLNQNDLDYNHRVCILGADLVQKLFKTVNPIDREIRVNNLRLKVIGIFEPRGQVFGQSRDNFLAMPLTVFQNEYGKYRNSLNITVMAFGPLSYNATIDIATGIFRTIRKVPPGEENDFEIFSNDSLIAQMNEVTKYVKWGSVLVALIALLAAGVGIMNIMLVSVTERTREIGIRKALGAKKRNILIQFLIESVTLSQFGGIIGIILGLLAGNMAGSLLKAPPAFPLDWIITGIALCIFVGIGFGTYPAYKAASLDPIEALRYE